MLQRQTETVERGVCETWTGLLGATECEFHSEKGRAQNSEKSLCVYSHGCSLGCCSLLLTARGDFFGVHNLSVLSLFVRNGSKDRDTVSRLLEMNWGCYPSAEG